MARAQFNREQVLENACNTFWRLGYNATSMQTVVQQTGLKPGSIYLAFGNKEGLFKASLQFYTLKSIATLTSYLAEYASPEESIPGILLGFVEEASQANYCSCFLVKSQLELGNNQHELHASVCDYLRQIERLYINAFLANDAPNEAAAKAASLMVHIFGIRVYGYHDQAKQQLIDALHLGLPWLNWKK